MNRQKEQYIKRKWKKPDGQWLLLDRRLMLIAILPAVFQLFNPILNAGCGEKGEKKEALSRPGNASENLG